MRVGIIGLGKMGQAITQRVLDADHKVIGFDLDASARLALESIGGTAVANITDIPKACEIIWLMVPAGKPVDDVLAQLTPHANEKTIIIDGGNSHFPDTVRRAQTLKKQSIAYLDCGTSGGLRGREIGFSLMIGGDKKAFEKIEPLFEAIATPDGYAHLGPAGAGHYVKMVHNGVEYALLQAYANGFNLLRHGAYENLDLCAIARTWNNGSVVRSWITELLEEIFTDDQALETISGEIGENLTGRWTLEEAKKQNIRMELLKKALEIRSWSRESGGNYATKVVAMLRNKFGGHAVSPGHTVGEKKS